MASVAAPQNTERQCRSSHRNAAQKGFRRELATERFGDQHQLRETHPRATLLFVEGNTGPAQFGHLLEERRRITEFIVGITKRSEAAHRRMLFDEIEGGLRNQLLIFVQYELHEKSLQKQRS